MPAPRRRRRRLDPRFVESANISARLAALNDGTLLNIVLLLDDEGDECGSEEACVFIATDNATWWVESVEDFEPICAN
jgi:hypothetical protein